MSRVINDSENRITCGWQGYAGHKGVDLGWRGDETQNQVYPNCKGTVIDVVDGVGTLPLSANSWGNYVLIQHENGMKTRYAHLRINTIKVSKGQQVDENTLLAIIGESGSVNGRHLHFEVYDTTGNRIDPTSYLIRAVCESSSTTNNTQNNGAKYKVRANGGLWLLDSNGTKIKVYPDGTNVNYISDGYDKYGYHYWFVNLPDYGANGYMAQMYLTKVEEPVQEQPKEEPKVDTKEQEIQNLNNKIQELQETINAQNLLIEELRKKVTEIPTTTTAEPTYKSTWYIEKDGYYEVYCHTGERLHIQ